MRFRSLLSVLAFILLLVAPAFSQVVGPSEEGSIAVLEREAAEIDTLSSAIQGGAGSDQLQSMKTRILEIQKSLGDTIKLLEPDLIEIDKRLGPLGEPAEGESADIGESRKQLRAERLEVDSAIKRGHLAEASATQALNVINQTLAETFNRNVFENIGSPLSPSFWLGVWRSASSDLAIVSGHARQFGSEIGGKLTPSSVTLVAASLLVAAYFLWPARRYLRSLGFKIAAERAPNTRVRRSGLAAWLALVGTLACFLSLTVIGASFRWSDLLPPAETSGFLPRLIGTLSFAAFVASVGNALILADRPSWRLPPISDDVARIFRFLPLATAGLLAAGVILLDAARVFGLSANAIAVANLVVTVGYALHFSWILFTTRKLRKASAAQTDNPDRVSPLLLGGLLLLRITLLITVVSAVAGYLNLSMFIGRGLVWIGIVAMTAYLLMLVIDDLCSAIFATDGPVAKILASSFGLRPNLVGLTGILISAFLRIAVAFLAIVWVFVPFGPGTGDVFASIGDLTTFSVAGITFEPGSLLRSVMVLVVSMSLVRLALSWIEGTYLPATNLDAGARNSVLMIVKYAGFILAGLWTINTLGIGMERIALVVSALSVGIGFGLQAITQNFISGLILLAERPLKIGDTVRLGDEEGDVKKISVRSTEIQISDNSTLIVPNSELITKTIRNMTPGEPVGRVQIAFSVPLDVDPNEVRRLMTSIYEDHPGILDDPQPTVIIASIADSRISFDSFAFVGSPRVAAQTKSAILFTLIERFRAADIPLTTG